MHYLVMVIGDNVEEQMEPFYQDLEVDEYEVGEVEDYEKQRMLDYYERQGEAFQSFDDCYKEHGQDWNWNSYRKDVDGIWKEYSTYNPNAEWDWYEIGGRWAGKIRVKEGVEYEMPNFSWGWPEEEKKKVLAERRADTALLKDIANVEQLSCYSVVHEGEWICLGDKEGNEEVQELLKTLSPDTRITFVDCHM